MKTFTKQIIAWCTALIFLVFITQRIFFFRHSFLENAASIVTYPVIVASSAIVSPIKNIFKRKSTFEKLYTRVEDMQKKYQDLIDENIKLKTTLNRYEAIQDLVDFQKRYKAENGIISKVLIKNFIEKEHSMLLNKGGREGIRKDMVAVHKTQLVGRVSEVFPYHCKVVLITDSSCKVAAHTARSKARGIAIGTNDINLCSLSYVSHLQKIDDNDNVLSSGEGLVFPEGFCLGRIAHHSVEGLYYKVDIKPIIDFTKLEFCVLLDRASTINF